MRTLTVKREKRFVACLAKMNVYMEDAQASELKINDIPCRKLGTLKNGEEKTFEIDDAAAKIFVIADSLSKSFCNDFYQLTEGADDIFLSGKNVFNPAVGNAFRFSGNESKESLANRKKSGRIGCAVLSVFVIIGILCGFFFSSMLLPRKKTFSANGMQITLTDDFRSFEHENFAAVYYNSNIEVYAEKEPFSKYEEIENMSCEEFGELIAFSSKVITDGVKTEDDLTFFFFERVYVDTKEIYPIVVYIYKTDDAFWLVQFVLKIDNFDAYADKITKWAKSVRFTS